MDQRHPFVLVASPSRDLVDKVRQHVPWVPVLSPVPEAFGSYRSVAELVRACGTAGLERRLMYKATVEPSGGLLNLADVKRRDLCDIPRTLSGFPRWTGRWAASGTVSCPYGPESGAKEKAPFWAKSWWSR